MNRHVIDLLFCETYLVFYILNFEKISKKYFFRNLFTLFKMFHQEPTPVSLNKKKKKNSNNR